SAVPARRPARRNPPTAPQGPPRNPSTPPADSDHGYSAPQLTGAPDEHRRTPVRRHHRLPIPHATRPVLPRIPRRTTALLQPGLRRAHQRSWRPPRLPTRRQPPAAPMARPSRTTPTPPRLQRQRPGASPTTPAQPRRQARLLPTR